jgi:hypothetical protein
VLDQIKDLGYNSYDSVFNLGTLGVLTMVYYLRVAFYYFGTKIYVPRFQKGAEYFFKLGKNLFWSEFLFIQMIAYFELLISGQLNLLEPTNAASGSFVAFMIGLYSCIITYAVVPLVFIKVLSKELRIIN